MAITHVQKVGSITLATGGASSTITVPAGGVTAGDAIIIAVCSGGATGNPSAIDTAGNTYVLRSPPGTITDGASGDGTAILDCLNCRALVSGNTITVTFATGNSEAFAIAEEFAGVGTATDGGAGAGIASASSQASGNVITTNANDLLFACVGLMNSSALSWSSGFGGGSEILNGTDGLGDAWQIVSATGTYNATATAGTASYMTLLAAYKAAGATSFPRSLTDSLALSESLASTSAHSRSLTGTLALSESLIGQAGKTRLLTDTARLAESLARTAHDARALTDSLALANSLPQPAAPSITYPTAAALAGKQTSASVTTLSGRLITSATLATKSMSAALASPQTGASLAGRQTSGALAARQMTAALAAKQTSALIAE